MKHYTSTELISRMAHLGYYFLKRDSRMGKIVFLTSGDGYSAYPVEFYAWKDVAFFVHDWKAFH